MSANNSGQNSGRKSPLARVFRRGNAVVPATTKEPGKPGPGFNADLHKKETNKKTNAAERKKSVEDAVDEYDAVKRPVAAGSFYEYDDPAVLGGDATYSTAQDMRDQFTNLADTNGVASGGYEPMEELDDGYEQPALLNQQVDNQQGAVYAALSGDQQTYAASRSSSPVAGRPLPLTPREMFLGSGDFGGESSTDPLYAEPRDLFEGLDNASSTDDLAVDPRGSAAYEVPASLREGLNDVLPGFDAAQEEFAEMSEEEREGLLNEAAAGVEEALAGDGYDQEEDQEVDQEEDLEADQEEGQEGSQNQQRESEEKPLSEGAQRVKNGLSEMFGNGKDKKKEGQEEGQGRTKGDSQQSATQKNKNNRPPKNPWELMKDVAKSGIEASIVACGFMAAGPVGALVALLIVMIMRMSDKESQQDIKDGFNSWKDGLEEKSVLGKAAELAGSALGFGKENKRDGAGFSAQSAGDYAKVGDENGLLGELQSAAAALNDAIKALNNARGDELGNKQGLGDESSVTLEGDDLEAETETDAPALEGANKGVELEGGDIGETDVDKPEPDAKQPEPQKQEEGQGNTFAERHPSRKGADGSFADSVKEGRGNSGRGDTGIRA